MQPDDHICYCYHVSLRKLVNFACRECPVRASQMSDCLGAGTGCGWCIPVLKQIHEQSATAGDQVEQHLCADLPDTAEQYATGRRTYLRTKQAKHRF